MISRFLNQLTEEERKNLTKLYLDDNLTLVQIGNIYGKTRETISKALKELNVEIRNSKFKQQYDVDKDFFKNINTEEKSYWLGFLYADGNIFRENERIAGFECCIHEKDLLHLQKFKESLKSTHNIYTKDKIYKRLCIGISEMGKDLIELGCLPVKSLVLKYPSEEQVPLELQHHFIRGYFDGDGSIKWSNEMNRYNAISIAGTQNFLTGIINFLNPSYNFSIIPENNIFCLNIQNKEGLYEFYDKVYKNASIYLNRKYQRFQDFFNHDM